MPAGHRFEGSVQSRVSEPTVGAPTKTKKREAYVSCVSACTLVEMESGPTKQMTGIADHSPDLCFEIHRTFRHDDPCCQAALVPMRTRSRGRLGRDFSPDPVCPDETQHKFGLHRLQNRGSEQRCSVPWKSTAKHSRYVEQRAAPANQAPVVRTVTDDVAFGTQDRVLQGDCV